MAPTLNDGQIAAFIRKKRFDVGDIVIAKVGQREVVKRVNEINEGMVSLIGDNLHHSTDSRTYGRISHKNLIGRLIWPIK